MEKRSKRNPSPYPYELEISRISKLEKEWKEQAQNIQSYMVNLKSDTPLLKCIYTMCTIADTLVRMVIQITLTY